MAWSDCCRDDSDGRPLLRPVAEFVGEGMGGPPAPYTQRMVRSGDWKLCYYHQHADGQPWQVIQIANSAPVLANEKPF